MRMRNGASFSIDQAPRLAATVAAGLLAAGIGSGAASAQSPVLELTSAGELKIDGRQVACKSNIQTILDGKLPNLGIATRSQLVLNPHLLRRMSPTVRLFVYHHECGHHHIGGDELGADCWAVRAGISNGWLQERQLTEICASFGNAKATATHPATAQRCRALQKCYAAAKRAPPETTASISGAAGASAPPPQLLHEGFSAPISQER